MSLPSFQKALENLSSAYITNPSELERDGLIQRFKYTLELCWRSSQKTLRSNGILVDTPRSTFNELANIGWVDSAEAWLQFIRKRNMTNYIYNKVIAEDIFKILPEFIKSATELHLTLRNKLITN